METVYSEFIKYFGSEVAISLGALILLIYVVNSVMGIQRSWIDRRLGIRALEVEKLRLEHLKLRYEIEVLKKTHQLPDLEDTADEAALEAEAVIEPPDPLQSDSDNQEDVVLWNWLETMDSTSPLKAWRLTSLILIVVVLSQWLFGILAVTTPITYATDQSVRAEIGGFWSVVWVEIVYIMLWAVFTSWSRSIRSQRKLLTLGGEEEDNISEEDH